MAGRETPDRAFSLSAAIAVLIMSSNDALLAADDDLAAAAFWDARKASTASAARSWSHKA